MSIVASLNKRFNLQRFWRGEGPQPSPIILKHRSVYILPTRQGIYFALLLFAMLLGSINYSNSLGYMLTFLLASLAIVAILHTYRNLLRLRISLGHLNSLFCGDNGFIPVILNNPKQGSRYAIELYFPHDEPVTCDIPSNTRLTIQLPFIPKKRGRHTINRFVIASCFPVGLFRSWAHVQLAGKYLVYPKPLSNYPLPQHTTEAISYTGHQGKGSEDFAGLRTYHPGDSLRHIHWKAVARQQGMLTKQFGGDACKELWLDWHSITESDIEKRLSILTYWVLEADRNGLIYGLRLPTTQLKPSSGLPHQQQCLQALAIFGIPDVD